MENYLNIDKKKVRVTQKFVDYLRNKLKVIFLISHLDYVKDYVDKKFEIIRNEPYSYVNF